MAEMTQETRCVYVVNNTRKEVRLLSIPTQPQAANMGVVTSLFSVIGIVKTAWNIFTGNDWNPSDDIVFLKDVDYNLTEYQEKGYVLE